MLDNVGSILREECKLARDRPIIVGVSGGPDSLCLMEFLRKAGYPIIVAHFNHQLRPDAGLDEQAVEQTASGLGLDSVIERADVRAHAEQEKLSVEEAARDLRYRFMFRIAHERHAQAVSVGHTADDQVETVLMHFLRGTGLAGLQGMSYRSIIQTFDADIPVVRPLLDVWRAETIAYCTASGFRPHYDSSNESLEFQRNRIRHLLIPNLETYNPNLRAAILRMSQTLKGDHLLLQEVLEVAWRETVSNSSEDAVTFDASRLSQCSTGLQRNLIKQSMRSLCPGLELDFAVIERACFFINGRSRAPRVDLKGGLRMFREAGKIHLCRSDANLPLSLWPQMRERNALPFPLPGQIDLAAGWKFKGERSRIPELFHEQAERNEDRFQVWLDADALPGSLELRTRLQGDQFAPLGLDGHSQKLSDFMVNEKIPRRARDHWPLLCSGKLVIWVPGYRPAHPFRLTESTHNVSYFYVSGPPDKVEQ